MNERAGLSQSHETFTGPLVQFSAWAELPWLKHGSSTRGLALNSQDRCADVITMQELMEIQNQPVVLLNQRHTANVALLTEMPETAESNQPALVCDSSDAIVCTKPGVTCAIFTADCVPIFVVDIKNRIVGLAHAGWKGTLHEIAKNLVLRMIEAGAEPPHMNAWIGPCIRREHYEVSPEMIGWFDETFAEERKSGCDFSEGRLLDLPLLNICLLQNMEIPQSKIFDSGICTFANNSAFHSYRAAGESAGRIVSLITMV